MGPMRGKEEECNVKGVEGSNGNTTL